MNELAGSAKQQQLRKPRPVFDVVKGTLFFLEPPGHHGQCQLRLRCYGRSVYKKKKANKIVPWSKEGSRIHLPGVGT